MNSYKVIPLYSGSKGNSVLIKAGGANILIDAGKSAGALCAALKSVGSDIGEIDAIFITHEHTDHIGALDILTKKHRIPIHIPEISARKFDRSGSAHLHECLVRQKTIYNESIAGIKVKSFRTPHDSMMSVGYRIDVSADCGKNVSIGIATDIGCVTREICEGLFGCETVVIESNHDTEMLMEGRYPRYLKERVSSERGHLSNEQSAELTAHLAKAGTKAIILAHLSEDNNIPEIALAEHRRTICDPNVMLVAANQYEPFILEMKQTEETKRKEEKFAFG